MVAKRKVCKECGSLTFEKECEICHSRDLADKYKGTIFVFDAENSEIAKRLDIKKDGLYALKY